MSDDEILNSDLRYIFELVRINNEMNNPNKEKEKEKNKSNKVVDEEEKFIDDIL